MGSLCVEFFFLQVQSVRFMVKGSLPFAFLVVFLLFLVSGAWGLGNLGITGTRVVVIV